MTRYEIKKQKDELEATQNGFIIVDYNEFRDFVDKQNIIVVILTLVYFFVGIILGIYFASVEYLNIN